MGVTVSDGDHCSKTEYCCPDAKHCLTPTNVSCAKDPSVCPHDQTCCPLTKLCVTVGDPCEGPCKEDDTYCCPDALACLQPTNPGVLCHSSSDCNAVDEFCCPLTNLCVKAFEKCHPLPLSVVEEHPIVPEVTVSDGDHCSKTEYCCPDAKHCLTPTNVSCAKDPSVCPHDQTCCPLTKLCVTVGDPCESPCKEDDTYCCPDALAFLQPTNPGVLCH